MLQISYLNSDVSYLTTDFANSYVDIFAKYMSELSHTSLGSRFPSWQNKKVTFMYLPFFRSFSLTGFLQYLLDLFDGAFGKSSVLRA